MIIILCYLYILISQDNKKTRNRAYDLLVKFGHACADEDQEGKKENLQGFFNMVIDFDCKSLILSALETNWKKVKSEISRGIQRYFTV